jgi:hypothetical protein
LLEGTKAPQANDDDGDDDDDDDGKRYASTE